MSSTTEGTYYLHVLTTDIAGNVKETISNAVTIESPYPTLASEVSIGDYVAYDSTNNYSYTSPTGTGPSHGNGSSEQTFTSSSDIKWRVLSTDVTTGEVVLISEAPIGSFTMSGAIGYLYAEQELNEICKIYGYGKGADTSKTFRYVTGDTIEGTDIGTITGSGARSINFADIDSITGFNLDKSDFVITGSDWLELRYPTKNTSDGLTASCEWRRYYSNGYNYYAKNWINLGTGSDLWKILFGNTGNYSYFLATRMITNDENNYVVRFKVCGASGDLVGAIWDVLVSYKSYGARWNKK